MFRIIIKPIGRQIVLIFMHYLLPLSKRPAFLSFARRYSFLPLSKRPAFFSLTKRYSFLSLVEKTFLPFLCKKIFLPFHGKKTFLLFPNKIFSSFPSKKIFLPFPGKKTFFLFLFFCFVSSYLLVLTCILKQLSFYSVIWTWKLKQNRNRIHWNSWDSLTRLLVIKLLYIVI